MAECIPESAVHVVAAAVYDPDGRVLVAKRPDHAHQGGLWEFPGGKLEPGEDRVEGLRRELDEELGIELTDARPLFRVRHDYGDRAVLLDVWKVNGYRGQPHGREGQPLQWMEPDALLDLDMPAADVPIVSAVRLPDRYAITGDCEDIQDFERRLDNALAQGLRMVQLRVRETDDDRYRALAQLALDRCRAQDAKLLLNADPELARALGADGVHLSAGRLMAARERPLPRPLWVGASCHDENELRHAAAIGADFAVLSPILPTASHPGAPTLGWPRTQALLDGAALPVYVLGGVGPDDLPQAWAVGAQGVAAVRAFWSAGSP